MKKLIIAALAAATIAMAVPSTAVAEQAHKGELGVISDKISAGDYNEGKDISIREWLRLIPFVNIVVAVLDTVDGYNGVTRSQLHAEQPSYF